MKTKTDCNLIILQSPPKESKHLHQGQVLKSQGDYKFKGCDISHKALDQLKWSVLRTPTFHLVQFSFEYLPRQKCILSFGGDRKGRACLVWEAAPDVDQIRYKTQILYTHLYVVIPTHELIYPYQAHILMG